MGSEYSKIECNDDLIVKRDTNFEMIQTCEMKYPGFIEETPVTVQINTSDNYEKILLILFNGLLFKVNILYVKWEQNLEIGIHFLGTHVFQKCFMYYINVKMKNNVDYEINICDITSNLSKLVLPEDEICVCVIKIDHKYDILKVGCPKCTNCKEYTNLPLYSSGGLFCANCIEESAILTAPVIIFPCKNRPKGCLVSGTQADVLRHESLFCEYGSYYCIACKRSFDESVPSHYLNKHRDRVYSDTIVTNLVKVKKCLEWIIYFEDIAFVCRLDRLKELSISTDLPPKHLKLFECIFIVRNPETQASRSMDIPLTDINEMSNENVYSNPPFCIDKSVRQQYTYNKCYNFELRINKIV